MILLKKLGWIEIFFWGRRREMLVCFFLFHYPFKWAFVFQKMSTSRKHSGMLVWGLGIFPILSLSSFDYHIWEARNNTLWNQAVLHPDCLVNTIQYEVCWRVQGMQNEKRTTIDRNWFCSISSNRCWLHFLFPSGGPVAVLDDAVREIRCFPTADEDGVCCFAASLIFEFFCCSCFVYSG